MQVAISILFLVFGFFIAVFLAWILYVVYHKPEKLFTAGWWTAVMVVVFAGCETCGLLWVGVRLWPI
jgi:hypothetical protein